MRSVFNFIAKILIVIAVIGTAFWFGTIYPLPMSKSQAMSELKANSEIEFTTNGETLFIYRNNRDMDNFYEAIMILDKEYLVYVIDLTWENEPFSN